MTGWAGEDIRNCTQSIHWKLLIFPFSDLTFESCCLCEHIIIAILERFLHSQIGKYFFQASFLQLDHTWNNYNNLIKFIWPAYMIYCIWDCIWYTLYKMPNQMAMKFFGIPFYGIKFEFNHMIHITWWYKIFFTKMPKQLFVDY